MHTGLVNTSITSRSTVLCMFKTMTNIISEQCFHKRHLVIDIKSKCPLICLHFHQYQYFLSGQIYLYQCISISYLSQNLIDHHLGGGADQSESSSAFRFGSIIASDIPGILGSTCSSKLLSGVSQLQLLALNCS